MTNRRTDVANNFQTVLTQPVGPTSLSFPVETLGGLTSPCFITLAPDDPSLREVVYCDGVFGGSSFVTSGILNRGLEGSNPGAPSLHEVGTVVVISPLAQHLDDVNDRITAHDHTGALQGPPISHDNLRDVEDRLAHPQYKPRGEGYATWEDLVTGEG